MQLFHLMLPQIELQQIIKCFIICCNSICGNINAIISFDVATNRVTTNNKAFYFKDKKSLISILENTSVDEIDINRKVMKEISKSLYTWNRISNLYSNLFIN